MSTIIISSPSRLHFGIINPFQIPPRAYICLGLAIKIPRYVIKIKKIEDGLVIKNLPDNEVGEVIHRIMDYFQINGLEIDFKSIPPRHSGLGSTTQIVLSLGLGISKIFNKEIDLVKFAKDMNRGRISGIGTYIFQFGGFVIDSGKKIENVDEFPKLMFRIDFPEDWYFIIAIPSGRGPSEIEEEKLFKQLIPGKELVKEATYILLHEFIPSILDRDIESFGKALTKLQEIIGKMFENVQGGIYNPISIKCIEIFKKFNVLGYGQSSWGPTIYAVVEDLDKAYQIRNYIVEKLKIRCYVTTADNKGVRISKLSI